MKPNGFPQFLIPCMNLLSAQVLLVFTYRIAPLFRTSRHRLGWVGAGEDAPSHSTVRPFVEIDHFVGVGVDA